jgi:hypothetical protein
VFGSRALVCIYKFKLKPILHAPHNPIILSSAIMAKVTVWIANNTATAVTVTYRNASLVSFNVPANSTRTIDTLDYNSAREFKFTKTVAGSKSTATKLYYFLKTSFLTIYKPILSTVANLPVTRRSRSVHCSSNPEEQNIGGLTGSPYFFCIHLTATDLNLASSIKHVCWLERNKYRVAVIERFCLL